MKRTMTEPIRIQKAAKLKTKPNEGALGFGQIFTDHMFLADFHEGEGWDNARVEPYGPLALDPAAAVLHYSQAVFDGLKAFRGVDGKIRLLRKAFPLSKDLPDRERHAFQIFRAH